MACEADRMDWALRARPNYAGDKLLLIMLAQCVDADKEQLSITDATMDMLTALCCAQPGFVDQCLKTLAEQGLVSMEDEYIRLNRPRHETLPA